MSCTVVEDVGEDVTSASRLKGKAGTWKMGRDIRFDKATGASPSVRWSKGPGAPVSILAEERCPDFDTANGYIRIVAREK